MIELIGPLYNWLQQFTNHYLTHCQLLPTGHSTGTIPNSNCTVYSEFRVTLRLALYCQSVRLGAKPIETHDQNLFSFQLNTCGYSPYVVLSDERMGLSFRNAAGPRRRSHSQVRVPGVSITTFYCLRLETPPTWRTRSPYLYPPGTGWPGYTPRHWVPIPSPFTTRRATVEVFDSASTR
jgi:hypothetical protein